MSKWNPPNPTSHTAGQTTTSIPSANFKALCKQVTKLYESVVDIWPPNAVCNLMLKVHERFIASVKVEVRSRNLLPPTDKNVTAINSVKAVSQLAATRRTLMSEITFYAACVLRLDVIPAELLEQTKLVEQIFLVPEQELQM